MNYLSEENKSTEVDTDIRTFSGDKDLVNRRRREIVICATDLFIKQGYDRTSIRELSKAINMTPAGIYHYIGTKDDILRLITSYAIDRGDNGFRRIEEAVKGLDTIGVLRVSIRRYFMGIAELKNMYNFINHVMVNMSPGERQRLYDSETRWVVYFQSIIEKGIQEGVFKESNTEMVAHNIILIGQAWANRGWYLRKHFTIEKYVEEQTNIIFRMIL